MIAAHEASMQHSSPSRPDHRRRPVGVRCSAASASRHAEAMTRPAARAAPRRRPCPRASSAPRHWPPKPTPCALRPTSNSQNEATPPDFGKDGPQPDELEASADYFQASADGQQELFDQLSQLQPASDVADDWQAFLKSYETSVVEDASSLAEQAAAGDPDKFFSTALDNQAQLAGSGANVLGPRHEGLCRQRYSGIILT